jgi:hypothetical protein
MDKKKPQKGCAMAKPGRDEKGLFLPGNQLSVGNNGGRPRAYETPEELQEDIDKWFAHCDKTGDIPQLGGFTVFSRFGYMEALQEYVKNHPEFSGTIKTLKERVYHAKFQAACRREIPSAIFQFDTINNHHGYVSSKSDNHNQTDLSGKFSFNDVLKEIQVESRGILPDPDPPLIGQTVESQAEPDVIECDPSEQKPEGIPPVGE